MKVTLVAASLFTTAFAQGGLAAVPQCAMSCLIDAIGQDGQCVGNLDPGCLCPRMDALTSLATGCVLGGCGQEVALNQVLPAVKGFCAGASPTPTPTPAVPGSSEPAQTPTPPAQTPTPPAQTPTPPASSAPPSDSGTPAATPTPTPSEPLSSAPPSPTETPIETQSSFATVTATSVNGTSTSSHAATVTPTRTSGTSTAASATASPTGAAAHFGPGLFAILLGAAAVL